MCLYGILSGTRVFKPKADIRDSLKIEKWATPAIGVSLAVYIWALIQDYGLSYFSVVSGSLSLAILIGMLWCSRDFDKEYDRLTEVLNDVGSDE